MATKPSKSLIEDDLPPVEVEKEWSPQVMAGIGASALSFLLLLAFAGGPFNWLREELGLAQFFANDGGVYADCSLEKNRGNKFCRKEYLGILKPKKDYFYKSPKDWVPFSLNEGSPH